MSIPGDATICFLIARAYVVFGDGTFFENVENDISTRGRKNVAEISKN